MCRAGPVAASDVDVNQVVAYNVRAARDPMVRQTKVELARRRKPDETAASGTSDDVESHGAAARARRPKGGRPKAGR